MMRLSVSFYPWLLSTLIISFWGAFIPTQLAHADVVAPDVYVASNDAMGDVQRALDEAKVSDKQLLVVMGASWCHDSRGLASRFATPDLAAILKRHYQVVYVDVGYFNDLRHISERFGQAHYFATPTVMIINAESEQLVNASSMAQWGSADSIPLNQYIEYFTHHATVKSEPQTSVSPQNQVLINDFKTIQAQRLMDAYAKLVPDMKKEDSGKEPSDSFFSTWREVRTYRLRLQQDIQALYNKAHSLPSQPVALPTYASFSWE